MNLIDYTHPEKVPSLGLPHDRRSANYYLRLDELPANHPYHAIDWALFRSPEWLEGGSAWLQAKMIAEDVLSYSQEKGLSLGLVRPVVGSADSAFDEALAQALRLFELSPMVAEVTPRDLAQRKEGVHV